MTRQIYTYTDLRNICTSSFYPEIKNLPQITVTTDLRKAIQWYPKNNQGKHLFHGEVRDFGQIFDALDPEWKTSELRFRQTVMISGMLRQKIRDAKTKEEKNYYRGFKRNSAMIVKAIDFLEETCVSPSSLLKANPNNKDISLFCELWEEMLDEDYAIYELHNIFDKLKSSQKLRRKMDEIFGCSTAPKIVLHGFYFISPLQERFFRALENGGYQLVFLIPYHPEYPVAMQNWTEAYSQKFGFAERDQWHISGSPMINPIGELLEGRLETTVSNNIDIHCYRNTIEFAQAIKSDKENGVVVYSPTVHTANSILREFYPEEFGERRLLSYPVGHFLMTLHSVWDDDDRIAKLTAEKLREIFASGWLSVHGTSSREYVRDLEAILPYFEDCETLPQWRERLSHLKAVVETAVEPFRQKSMGSKDARWIDVMGNPLAQFSMFAVEPDRLYEVVCFVERIAQIAEDLFAGNQDTSIAKHMTKLSTLVRTGISADNLLAEESAVIHELIQAIDRLRSKNLDCDAGDIVSAVCLYLNGDLDDEEEDNSKLVGMVYPLSQIDAAVAKFGGKIHICMTDGDHMPGTPSPPYWPLDMITLANCCELCNDNLLDLAIQNYKNAPINNRYYLFSAFQNQDITLSWIEEIGAKKQTPSPYILMLQETGQRISSVKQEYLSPDVVSETPSASPMISQFKISRDLPKDVRMDYAVCPLKYLYGYVLDIRPKFISTFQQGHALRGLIQAIMTVMKEQRIGKEEVAKQVFSLFPQMRQVEKQQILDYISSAQLDKALWNEYGEYMYPPARFNISYPEESLRENASMKYAELASQIGRSGMDLYSPTDVKGACVYCPHVDYCRNAIHALDQGDYYA